jgi:hypothetical protein
MVRIGFDLDGVLFRSPPGVERKDYRPIYMADYYRLQVPTGLKPSDLTDDFFLVTARRNRYRKPTLETLKKFGIVDDDFDDEARLLMLPRGGSKNNQMCIDHKVSAVNDNDILMFYEDDERIARALHEETDATVVHVREWSGDEDE